MRFTTKLIGLFTFALLCFSAPSSHAATSLKLSSFLPPSHGIPSEMIAWWAEEVEKRSNGEISFRQFHGGSLGNVRKQYDQVANGVVDVAFGLHGSTPGRFPLTSILELPFMLESADTATQVLMNLIPEYLEKEHPKVKILMLTGHNAGVIHLKEKRVETPQDLEGLRIRFPTKALKDMLSHLGATPVGLPPTKVYENLSKGVIDGTVFTWETLQTFKLGEVTNYHLDARIHTSTFFFVMNQKTYNKLSDSQKKVVDEVSAELVDRAGGYWNAWDDLGMQVAAEKKNKIYRLSEKERASWKTFLEPMTNTYLDEIEKQNKPAKKVYKAMQDLIESYGE